MKTVEVVGGGAGIESEDDRLMVRASEWVRREEMAIQEVWSGPGEEVWSGPGEEMWSEQLRSTGETFSKQEGLPLGVTRCPGELNTDIGLSLKMGEYTTPSSWEG